MTYEEHQTALKAAALNNSPNDYAQAEIEYKGLQAAIENMEAGQRLWVSHPDVMHRGNAVSPEFMRDVATLLRLETASDEGAE